MFLRGLPLTGGNYADEGVVMVGNDSLEISADQAVLVPIIMANYVAGNSDTSDWLYGMVRSHILGGDHPPHKEQLRINGKPINDRKTDDEQKMILGKYDIETPVFMISIPDSPVGMSLKHQIENPIESSGFFPSVTRGYFVMLKLNAGENYYRVLRYRRYNRIWVISYINALSYFVKESLGNKNNRIFHLLDFTRTCHLS